MLLINRGNMMQKPYRSVYFLLFFISNTFFSQSLLSENSLLWKISGKDLQQSSYILITYPEVCNQDFVLDNQIVKTIQSVDQYVMPINLGDESQLYEDIMSRSKVPVIEGLTNEEIVLLKKHIGKLDETYEDAKGESALLIFGMARMKFFNNCAYDFREMPMEYMQIALNNKKTTIGLEEAKDMNKSVNAIYSSKKLIQTLLHFDQVKNLYQKGSKAYSSGNLDEAYKNLTNELVLDDQEKRIMIEDRNSKWLDKIIGHLASKSSVFAIPIENAYGDKGIINLIKGKGYKIVSTH